SIFGMEAALFCPSGTMTNQIAIKCHTKPGNEVICDKTSHIYQYEGGGLAFNAGCSVKLIDGERGLVKAKQVLESINPDDVHKPPSALVSLENSSNLGGGSCYDWSEILEIKEVCSQKGLALHIDGARLFNALIAKNQKPEDYGRIFDSISVCLSKGLGAPVGSLLLGKKDFIKNARRIRKIFGGGMRQAGYLAAAGIYALQHNVQRLKEDHLHAQQIAAALNKKSFVKELLPVETNIIIFSLKDNYSVYSFAEAMKAHDIYVIAISSDQIRMVLHLDITKEMAEKTIQVIESL
ncbi:MAG: GntG family PLP-dependent aldolase, partial [Chitinophagaceae bacterium]|nr:GntG family PLP-dependent aldolase [Chitinophagaceae bacterium]